MIYSYNNHTPTYAKVHQQWSGWVADSATVIGQVYLGEDVSVWFGAVVRADTARIVIGDMTNVQDNAVLHVDAGVDMVLGSQVTVGHNAVLHGCTVGDNTLIGINAVVLNHAKIGKNCIIGANALISEGQQIPDNSLVMGTPGKVVKQVTAAQVTAIAVGAAHYATHYKTFKNNLIAVHAPVPGKVPAAKPNWLGKLSKSAIGVGRLFK